MRCEGDGAWRRKQEVPEAESPALFSCPVRSTWGVPVFFDALQRNRGKLREPAQSTKGPESVETREPERHS